MLTAVSVRIIISISGDAILSAQFDSCGKTAEESGVYRMAPELPRGGRKMTAARDSRVLRAIPLLTAICFVSFPAYAKYGGGGDRDNPQPGGTGRIYVDDIRVTKRML
jgi:hypothetical protein